MSQVAGLDLAKMTLMTVQSLIKQAAYLYCFDKIRLSEEKD